METCDKGLPETVEGEDNLKCIIWEADSSVGIVPCPRGTIWSTMGRVVDSKMTVCFEEALYLIEFFNYKIIRDDLPLSIDSFLGEFCVSRLNDYEMYRDLRRHGYVLMAHDSPYYPNNSLFQDSRPEWSIFKPNSSFKKTEPKGHLGHLVGLNKSDSITKIAHLMKRLDEEDSRFMLGIPDGSSQFAYFEATVCQPIPEPSSPSRSKCKPNKINK